MPTDFRGNSIKMMDSQTPNWEPEENQSGEDIHYHGKIVDKSLVNEILRQHKEKKTMNNLTLERIAELREKAERFRAFNLEDYADLLAALATLEALAEENAALKAGDEDILVKAKELSIEVDTAVEKAKGYKSRAEKAEAELTQKTKDYDWMMAQHDAWKACAFKEAGLKDGFKAELDKARPMVEAAVAVVEAAKENPLTSEMQAVVGDLRAALATLEALAEENAALKCREKAIPESNNQSGSSQSDHKPAEK